MLTETTNQIKSKMTNKNTIHRDFNLLFSRKERIALMGNRLINLWTLVAILFVTFAAIGFANGSLAYLEKKMSDPYVNVIDIRLSTNESSKSREIINKCNLDSIKSVYQIISTSGYNIYWLNLADYNDNTAIRDSRGRTIELNDTLLQRITSEAINGTGFKSEFDFGLIVTKSLLDKFHYPENTKYILHNYTYTTYSSFDTIEVELNIPIPVFATVESLPDNAEFLSLPFLYYNRSHNSNRPFITKEETSLWLFVDGNEQDAKDIKHKIEQALKENTYYKRFDPIAYLNSHSAFNDYFNVKLTFDPSPENILFVDSVYNFLVDKNVFAEADKDILRIYDIEGRLDGKSSKEYHAIAVNFEELDRIRAFAEYMSKKNDINIDIAKIESKENYSFVTNLTQLISIILIGFSILSISLFLSNLLRNHLERISMNIGTFKAFGLDSKSLLKIYLKVIFRVVFEAMTIAIIAAWIFGILGGMRLVLMVFGSGDLEPGENYFLIYHERTLLSVILVSIVSSIVLVFTAHRILRKSPGDLIYNR